MPHPASPAREPLPVGGALRASTAPCRASDQGNCCRIRRRRDSPALRGPRPPARKSMSCVITAIPRASRASALIRRASAASVPPSCPAVGSSRIKSGHRPASAISARARRRFWPCDRVKGCWSATRSSDQSARMRPVRSPPATKLLDLRTHRLVAEMGLRVLERDRARWPLSRARPKRHEARQTSRQRRFPGAVGTKNCQDFARPQRERHVAQHHGPEGRGAGRPV